MLKRIQKRVERKDREVAPLKSKKSTGKDVAVSGSEEEEVSGSEAGSEESDESEEEGDRDELMSMSGEGELVSDSGLGRFRKLKFGMVGRG
jgi:hypothetical protein